MAHVAYTVHQEQDFCVSVYKDKKPEHLGPEGL
jgi:hypothetical protein